FMDVESIDAGQFEQVIFNQIEARAHFLVILTAGTVERCAEPNDMMRREIEHALDQKRNIVPLLISDFNFKETEPYLTGKLNKLSHYNGLNVPHDYFDAAMERLRGRFLQQPVYGEVKPTPDSDQPLVQKKIEETAAQPAPSISQLTAELYHITATMKHRYDDLDGALVDYDEAIRLIPRFTYAYHDRGITRNDKGDLDGALADFDKAIQLDPKLGVAYNSRGVIYTNKDNLDGALADLNEAIRLNPRFAGAYVNRGVVYFNKGNLDSAFADFNEAIRYDAKLPAAYMNRGIVFYSNDDLAGAIADFSKTIRLSSRNAEPYTNRGVAYFTAKKFDKALKDFRQANNLKPGENKMIGGLAITHYSLGQKIEAKRIWRSLVAQDQRFRDADWVGKELNWKRPELIEAARKLIAEL
ncbi:MAG: tetratricopeptide repeat protein, partial [Chloroflexota bacterium]